MAPQPGPFKVRHRPSPEPIGAFAFVLSGPPPVSRSAPTDPLAYDDARLVIAAKAARLYEMAR